MAEFWTVEVYVRTDADEDGFFESDCMSYDYPSFFEARNAADACVKFAKLMISFSGKLEYAVEIHDDDGRQVFGQYIGGD